MEEYAVYERQFEVGKVCLQEDGLYTKIVCYCHPLGDKIYRLSVESSMGSETLGVLVPDGDGFMLMKRVPSKRIGSSLSFSLISGKEDSQKNHFAPIYPEEPFAYISGLKNAFFMKQNETTGVMIQEAAGE